MVYTEVCLLEKELFIFKRKVEKLTAGNAKQTRTATTVIVTQVHIIEP